MDDVPTSQPAPNTAEVLDPLTAPLKRHRVITQAQAYAVATRDLHTDGHMQFQHAPCPTHVQGGAGTMSRDTLLSGAAALDPASLDAHERWVLWKNLDRGGRATKVPIRPDGETASAANPHDWFTRAICASAQTALGADGVGIILGPLADGTWLGGLDFDNCRHDDALTPWAQVIVDRLATYTEVSPSGTGVKAFFTLTPEDASAIRTLLGDRDGRKWSTENRGDHPPAIELYLKGRYFTFTGRSIGAPYLRTVSKADLVWLMEAAAHQFPGKSPEQRTNDNSRSAKAFRRAMAKRADGHTFEDFVDALGRDPDLAGWLEEKGAQANGRELQRAWARAGDYLQREDAEGAGDLSGPDNDDHIFGDLDRFRIANMTQGEPPKLRFLLDGLMPLGTLGVVYGPGGVGKSLFAMDICLEVANLTPANDNTARPHAILGSTVPPYARGASVFITLEDDEDEVHRRTTSLDPDRTRRNGPCYVITASSLDNFDPALVTMKDRAAVLTKLAERELPKLLDRIAKDAGCPVRVLVLDPAGDFINGDENDAAPVKLLMRSLRTLSAQFDTTIILLGHVPKAGKRGQQTMRGSSAWMANARFAYSLQPKKSEAKSGEAKGNTGASKAKAGASRLIEGCLTKANHAGAPIDQATVFYRDERGRLVRATSDALGCKAEPTDDDLVAMLVQQCAKYAEAGMPFAYSGQHGLWEGRADLDKPLSGLAKNRLEELGRLALESGALIKVKTTTCTKATYLDVPDGALAQGVVVDMPSGSRRHALRERQKAADRQEEA